MTIDWATCTFDAAVDVSELVYGHRVFAFPDGDDASLLVPVHGYCSEDHFDTKGAQMARHSTDADWRITSAYLGDRTRVDLPAGPRWQEGRLTIDSDGTIATWHQSPTGEWTRTGAEQTATCDHFVECDVMTEIQFDEENDISRAHKGEVLTQWRWVRDTDDEWHRPDDVLTLQDGSNNDGDRARIDFAIDQADGRFYFYHYID